MPNSLLRAIKISLFLLLSSKMFCKDLVLKFITSSTVNYGVLVSGSKFGYDRRSRNVICITLDSCLLEDFEKTLKTWKTKIFI